MFFALLPDLSLEAVLVCARRLTHSLEALILLYPFDFFLFFFPVQTQRPSANFWLQWLQRWRLPLHQQLWLSAKKSFGLVIYRVCLEFPLSSGFLGSWGLLGRFRSCAFF